MIVYQHRKLTDNSIFYIGIGSRYDRPSSVNGRNRHWKYVVAKHGFKSEIVHECESRGEACYTEKYLIAYYGKENLTNVTDGGDGTWGIDPWNKGITLTDKQKTNYKNQFEKGHVMSEDVRRKISNTLKGFKRSERSQEHKDKIGDAKAIEISQFTKQGEFVKHWRSSVDACNELGISSANINQICKHPERNRKTAGGYIWKYKNNINTKK